MKQKAALIMLLPAMMLFVVAFLWPAVLVVRLSFFKTDYMTEQFVGGQNYVDAIGDRYFRKSFVNSLLMTLMLSPAITIGAYMVASAISDYGEKIQGAARFLFYVPGLTSGLIMGLLWKWILDRAGLINEILATFNVAAVPWLTEAWPARIAIVMVSLTSGLGGYIILYAVTMHAIPEEMRDAAMVDGASRRQYKRYIQLPLMMPSILLALLLAIVGIMQMWESIYVLTGEGGPEGSTASPVYEIFLTAFKFGKPGLAAAKGMILLAVIALIMVVKRRVESWLVR